MTDPSHSAPWRRALWRPFAWLTLPRGAYVGALSIAIGMPAVLDIAAKLHRIASHPKEPAAALWPGLLASNLMFQAGLGALALALFAACGPLSRVGLLLAQLPGLLSLLVATFAHGYYASTGQVLDYELLAFALGRWREVFGVVTAEAPAWMNAVALAAPVALLLLPWAWLRRGRGGPIPPPASPFGVRALATALLLGGFAAACFEMSQHPEVRGYRHGFARAPIVHLVWGASKQLSRGMAGRGHASEPRAVGATALKHRGGDMPNVVVVVLESTRARATTPYYRKLHSTPFMAEMAEQSVLVERAYAVVPHTSKALVSVLCGFEPRSTVDVVEATAGGMPGTCLAKLLAKQGYDTIYFQAPTSNFESRRVLTRNMGYRRFHSGERLAHEGLSRVNYFGYEDDIMLPPSQRFLARQLRTKRPFFATYLTNTAHSPYGVPKDFEVQELSKNKFRNRYYNAILYSDGFLRRLVDQYKAAGLYDNSIFVVVGDHGEGMREHGARGHDTILYDEGVTVPLLMRLPRGEGARRVPGPISQLSIAPTILDAAGFDVTAGRYEGVSFLRADSEPAIYMSCYRKRTCAAIVKGDRKLIYHYGDRGTELFDLSRDRKEREDLSIRHPGMVDEWTTELLNWSAAVELAHSGADHNALRKYVSAKPPQSIMHPAAVRFGSYFEFIGFDGPPRELNRKTRTTLRFHFKPLATIPEGYQLRIRIRAPGGASEQILDGVTVRGLYPLQRWKPGEYVTDLRSPRLGSWDRDEAALCIELLDARGLAVPAKGPQGRTEACYPVGALKVAPNSPKAKGPKPT